MAENARVFRLLRDSERESGIGWLASISTLYKTAYNVRVSNPPHQKNVRLERGNNVRLLWGARLFTTNICIAFFSRV